MDREGIAWIGIGLAGALIIAAVIALILSLGVRSEHVRIRLTFDFMRRRSQGSPARPPFREDTSTDTSEEERHGKLPPTG